MFEHFFAPPGRRQSSTPSSVRRLNKGGSSIFGRGPSRQRPPDFGGCRVSRRRAAFQAMLSFPPTRVSMCSKRCVPFRAAFQASEEAPRSRRILFRLPARGVETRQRSGAPLPRISSRVTAPVRRRSYGPGVDGPG